MILHQFAYGESGQWPNIPGYATVRFEVELLGIPRSRPSSTAAAARWETCASR